MSTNKNKTETTIEDIRQRLKNLTERRTKDLSHSHTNTQTQKTSETLENHRTGFTEPKEIKKPKLDLRLPFSSSADGHANIAIKSSLPSPKKDFRTPSVSQVPGTAEKKMKIMARSNSEKPADRKNTYQRKLIHNVEYSVLATEIGTGGSSKVYCGRSIVEQLDVAIKYVRFKGMERSVKKAYLEEIELLKELQGSKYVIKMYDYEITDTHLIVVMEKGETDLARFIKNNYAEINDIWIKHYWYQMLKCVKIIHDKNIVHSDLKPANFLFVQAGLKLIDFGIASKIQDDKTSVIKTEQMGTLNYMSPEMLGAVKEGPGTFKIPLKADVWSLGCILYLIVYGKTPFQHVNAMMKAPTILNEKALIDFPVSERANDELIDVLKRCLERDLKKRASVDELLNHPYLTQRQPLVSLSRQNSKSKENEESEGNDDDLVKVMTELNKYTPRTGARKLREKLTNLRSLSLE